MSLFKPIDFRNIGIEYEKDGDGSIISIDFEYLTESIAKTANEKRDDFLNETKNLIKFIYTKTEHMTPPHCLLVDEGIRSWLNKFISIEESRK